MYQILVQKNPSTVFHSNMTVDIFNKRKRRIDIHDNDNDNAGSATSLLLDEQNDSEDLTAGDELMLSSSLVSPPPSYRPGHFIAVRTSHTVQNCIFQSWDRAKGHLQGDDVDFAIFENFKDAMTYAFAFESEHSDTSGASDHHAAEDEPFALQDFLPEIMSLIFQFSHGVVLDGRLSAVSCLFRHVALLSKPMLQYFHEFVKCIPLQVERILSLNEESQLVPWILNEKVRLAQLYFEPSDAFDVRFYVHLLESCDTNDLRRINIIAPHSFTESSRVDERHVGERKWQAALSGVPIHVIQRRVDLTLEDLMNCIKNVNSLTHMHLIMQGSTELNFPMFLEELSLCLGSDEVVDTLEHLRRLTKTIPNMNKLRKLCVNSRQQDNAMSLRIKSKTLEELHINRLQLEEVDEECEVNIDVLEISCPSLKILSIGNSMHCFQPSLLMQSRSLEVMNLHLCARGGIISNEKIKNLCQVIEMHMPKLKELILHAGFTCDLNMTSKSLESISIEQASNYYGFLLPYDFRMFDCHCPLLRKLEVGGFIELNVSTVADTSTELEFLSLGTLLNFSVSRPDPDASGKYVIRANLLCEAIQEMKCLKKLHLLQAVEPGLHITSSSIEEIYCTVYDLRLMHCKCPLLKTVQIEVEEYCERFDPSEFSVNVLEVESLHLDAAMLSEDNASVFESVSSMITGMRYLKKLSLNLEGTSNFRIESATLEEICTSECGDEFMVSSCICPSLKVFSCAYDPQKSFCNGMQSFPINNDSKYSRFEVGTSSFDGLQVPASCCVEIIHANITASSDE